MANIVTRQTSRCLYCNQLNWGKGCRYAPHGIHFHADVSKLCAYCASPNYGPGCHLNPTGNIHFHGVNYNNMFRESLQSALASGLLINELQKPFEEFKCCKLGLIDKQGNKLREPITEEEICSFSPFVKTILRLKRYLGTKADLLNASLNLEKESIPLKEDINKYTKLIEHKNKIQDNISNLYKLVEDACNDGFSIEEVGALIKA